MRPLNNSSALRLVLVSGATGGATAAGTGVATTAGLAVGLAGAAILAGIWARLAFGTGAAALGSAMGTTALAATTTDAVASGGVETALGIASANTGGLEPASVGATSDLPRRIKNAPPAPRSTIITAAAARGMVLEPLGLV